MALCLEISEFSRLLEKFDVYKTNFKVGTCTMLCGDVSKDKSSVVITHGKIVCKPILTEPVNKVIRQRREKHAYRWP